MHRKQEPFVLCLGKEELIMAAAKKMAKSGEAVLEHQKRTIDAKKSLRRMQETIKPFLKKRRVTDHSTAGQWRDTSSLYS